MRLPFVCALVLATGVLTGCHDLLLITLGGKKDPPVHRVDGGASPGTAHAAAGTPFTGTATGQLGSRVTLKHGFVKSTMTAARYFGSFKATSSNPNLGPLSDAQWHGRLSGVRNRATGQIKLKGLILATFTDSTMGRACLKLSHRGKRKQNRYPRRIGASKITVLGGEGGAETLGGTATARVRISGHKIRLKGRVRRRERPATGFTPACTKLERKFGLTPL